MAGNNHCSK